MMFARSRTRPLSEVGRAHPAAPRNGRGTTWARAVMAWGVGAVVATAVATAGDAAVMAAPGAAATLSNGERVCRYVAGVNPGDVAFVSVIAVGAKSPGNATAYSEASPNTDISTVNFGQDTQLFPNVAALKVGADRKVCVRVNMGSTGVVIDFVGALKAKTPEGAPLVTSVGTRVIDTRKTGEPVQPGESRFVPFTAKDAKVGDVHLISVTTFGAAANGDAIVGNVAAVRNDRSNITEVKGVAVPKFMVVKLGQRNGTPGLYFNQRNTTVGFLIDDLIKVTPPAKKYFTVFGTPQRALDLRPGVQAPDKVVDFRVAGGEKGDMAVFDFKQTGANALGNFLVADVRSQLSPGTSTGNIYNQPGRISATNTGFSLLGDGGAAVTKNRFATSAPVFDTMALIDKAVLKPAAKQRLFDSRTPDDYPDKTPYVPTKPEDRKPLKVDARDWTKFCWDHLPPEAVEKVFSDPRAAEASGEVMVGLTISDTNKNGMLDVYSGPSAEPLEAEFACGFYPAEGRAIAYLLFGWDDDGQMIVIDRRFN